MTSTQQPDELVPIDEAARRLGLRASAIRYYEERGLIQAASRRSGRRWYTPSQVRRLAIIGYWQTAALMNLDEIGDILAGPAARRSWGQIIDDRIDALRIQIERMEEAREHLKHIRVHHHDTPPDGCPHYEALIWGEAETSGGPSRLHACPTCAKARQRRRAGAREPERPGSVGEPTRPGTRQPRGAGGSQAAGAVRPARVKVS
jgi:MerR family transcriptional regulator, copper efflux regulator